MHPTTDGFNTMPQSFYAPEPGGADGDDRAVELGLVFKADADGLLTGIRFFKEAENTGPHTGSIWSLDGELLATTTFADTDATGWQQADLDTPVDLDAGEIYVASYHAPEGGYSFTSGYFEDTHDTGPLATLGSSFKYGDGGVFPDETFENANYWVDVVVDFA